MSDTVLRTVSTHILALPRGVRFIAIDGVDGSGKTHFASRLAARLAAHASVILVHADDYLNPPAVRHARGRHSPEGFWLDTYDYAALARALDGLAAGTATAGDGGYEVYNTLVLVEGMFLHRDALVSRWDASVFLDAPFAETARRMAARDGSHPDPEHASMRRYVGGQRLYFAAARPWARATFVVDNTDWTHPRVVDAAEAQAAHEADVCCV